MPSEPMPIKVNNLLMAQSSSWPFINAQKDEKGNFKKDHHGNLIKTDLAKIYIMQKGENWGDHAPNTLKNGDWIYSAFKPNGDRLELSTRNVVAAICH